MKSAEMKVLRFDECDVIATSEPCLETTKLYHIYDVDIDAYGVGVHEVSYHTYEYTDGAWRPMRSSEGEECTYGAGWYHGSNLNDLVECVNHESHNLPPN